MKKAYRFGLLVILPFLFCQFGQAQLLDTTFHPGLGANGEIRNLLLLSDGKIIIGGLFTSYDGTSCHRIARLHPNGSLDTLFATGSGANGNVYTLDRQTDGKILVGGDFTTFNNTPTQRLVRLHADGRLDTSFRVARNPLAGLFAGASNKVFKVKQLPDGKILVAGCFSQFDGSSTSRFARLNANGSLDPTFTTSFSQFAWNFTVLPDGKILACFQGVGTLYRLNTDGSKDNTFNAGTGSSGDVFDMLVQEDGKILVAGGYLTFNGSPFRCLTRLNVNGSVDPTLSIGTGALNTIIKIAPLKSGKLFISGIFTSFNDLVTNRVARLEKNGSLDTSFNQAGTGVNEAVWCFAELEDEKLLLAGTFTSFDGKTAHRIIRISGKQPAPARPVITSTDSLSFCQGDSAALKGPAGYARYRWSNGATTQHLTVKANGSYSLQVASPVSEWSFASLPLSVTVLALPVQPILPVAVSLCAGESTRIAAPAGYASYEWSTGETSLSIVVTQSGTYWVKVKNAQSCESISTSVKVTVQPVIPKPLITAGSNLTLCQGEEVLLTAKEGFTQYQWMDGSTGRTVMANRSGTYWVDVLTDKGCGSRDSVRIQVQELPSTPTIRLIGSDSLESNLEASAYQWEKDQVPLTITSRKIKASQAGSYRLRVISDAGCLSAYSIPYTFVITGLSTAFNLPMEPYPNPIDQGFAISLPPGITKAEVTIFRIDGERVEHLAEYRSDQYIPTPHLAKGLYILQLQSGTHRIVKKIVITNDL